MKTGKMRDLDSCGMGVPGPDIVRAFVREFHDTYHLSYRKIAQIPCFSEFSPASLHRFKKRGKMTKAMRKKWSTKRHRIAISKRDPASAARSILGNVYFDIEELIKELENKENQ